MRIFLENQRITCTKTRFGYRIHEYFLRPEVLLLIEQAFEQNLEVKFWRGTQRGKGTRSLIRAYTPVANRRGVVHLDVELVHLEALPGIQRPRQRKEPGWRQSIL